MSFELTRRAALGSAVGLAGAVAAGAAATPSFAAAEQGEWLVGCGLSDVTGPVAEVGLFGYSMPQQLGHGIHLRCRARAFVFVDRASGKRVVFVTADLGAIFVSVHQGVISRLAALFGSLYRQDNVLINATHTHCSPGGAAWDAVYNLAVLGHQKDTYQANVDGIVEAIVEAHNKLAPGQVLLGRSELTNASVNRSRVAFENNPESDRSQFPLGIDPAVTVLRVTQGGKDVGAISWFSTHGTSMTNTNLLVSSDNKGYAAYVWEHDEKGVKYRDQNQSFVSAFAQTNSGDMSPNLNLKPGSGPTEDEFQNTKIIGQRQYEAAKAAFDAAEPLKSSVIDYRMCWVDMGNVAVKPQFTPDGLAHRTTPGCVGEPTVAGSVEDGPGIGVPEGTKNPLADALYQAGINLPPFLAKEQLPKLVLLPSGSFAPAWTPNVLPIQIMRLGDLYLAGGPAEFTIVSGLRIRRTLAKELSIPLEQVLMQGYANGYSQYVTTPEEYDTQQYEGGSTLFGRYTLPAYQQEFSRLATALRDGQAVPAGPTPPDLSQRQLNFLSGVVVDAPPLGRNFGDPVKDALNFYRPGSTVTVEFASGHPRNNLHRNGTFLQVQRLEGGSWIDIADDGDWNTIFRWERWGVAASKASISWDIPAELPAGKYRILHTGDQKNLWGTISAFSGTSRTFQVG